MENDDVCECGKCGTKYDSQSFRTLRLCGVSVFTYGDGSSEAIETRHCPCGSSVSVIVACCARAA